MVLFEIKNLSFSYPEAEKKALDCISLTVKEGELIVLCGPSGCGKTTLLRSLKPPAAPHGSRDGEILYRGIPLNEVPDRRLAEEIGFVFQNPDNQIVTDKVWHELSFTLESLGLDSAAIRRRTAEMSGFFGISGWFEHDTADLSGGQKQLLNLAAAAASSPKVLLLDEPTAQLDPVAAADFFSALLRISRELGTTVILSEHRLEEILPYADRAAVMENGRIIADGTPQAVGKHLKESANGMYGAMPSAMKIYYGLDSVGECPVSVRDGRRFLGEYLKDLSNRPSVERKKTEEKAPAIETRDLWFRYEKDSPDILKSLNLTVPSGSFFAVTGANGSGKSTLLSLLSGLLKPCRGNIRLEGKKIFKYSQSELYSGIVSLLPQSPQALFTKSTLKEELEEAAKARGVSEARLDEIRRLTDIKELSDRHPYDLSGGEQQRAALAELLLSEPRILLLDEPTKGIDAVYKSKLAGIIKRLCRNGTTVLTVSHDIEFCAEYADFCAMLFDGKIIASAPARDFFAGNTFYTTAANRISRDYFSNAVTNDEVVELCRKQKEN